MARKLSWMLLLIFFITFLLVVSETGLNLSGLPKVLCGWGIVTGSLQISRNISVSAEQFF